MTRIPPREAIPVEKAMGTPARRVMTKRKERTKRTIVSHPC
jgi:hypothetical protein